MTQEKGPEQKAKKKRHTHKWQFSKSYSPDYYKQVCACGAVRTIKRINAGLHEITYYGKKGPGKPIIKRGKL